MDDDIERINVKTAGGNTLQFFYNRTLNLLVIDLCDEQGRGGVEMMRKTLDESSMLSFLEAVAEVPA